MNILQTPLKIVNYPHPSLRHKGKPLTAIDDQVRHIARSMIDLMYEHKGLGLAAAQVGLPIQLFVANYSGDPEDREAEGVYINPVIVDRSGSVESEEGCLSFPQLYQKVRRAKTIRAQAYNLEGHLIEIQASDLAARIWQHEVDHLHGILFIDKLGPIGKIAARSTLREFEYLYKKAQDKGEFPPDEQIEATLSQLETML